MERLRQAIAREGKGVGRDIVKVDMFLNHRLDTALIFDIGQAIARHFAPKRPEIVLTVEASGIAIALAAARALGDIPVVFAKKGRAANQAEDMLTATAASFTHGTVNALRADRSYLPRGSRVLIVDDFLADGQAAHALMDIARQAGCELVGVGIAIEKGFQRGGRALRDEGVDLLSLTVVSDIADGVIRLADATEI